MTRCIIGTDRYQWPPIMVADGRRLNARNARDIPYVGIKLKLVTGTYILQVNRADLNRFGSVLPAYYVNRTLKL